MEVINPKFVTELAKIVAVILIPVIGVLSDPFNDVVNHPFTDLSFISPAGIKKLTISPFSYNPPDRGGPKNTQGTGTRI
jgi:hypothetical protein